MLKECKLPSGDVVALPWTDEVKSAIPDDIRRDVSYEKGWRLLYTSVEIIDSNIKPNRVDKNLNYILLYNGKSGVLKGFYYVEGDHTPLNNTAFFQLSTFKRTSLFNFHPYFAEVMGSENSPQKISLSVVSDNGIAKGFDLGWNCFLTELAYDVGSKDNKLNILGYVLNEATITLNGVYNAESKGTIVSSVSTPTNNKLVNGIASTFGERGKEWLTQHINPDGKDKNKPMKFPLNIIPGLLSGGVQSFAKSGLQKVFSSLLGASSTKEIFELQYTTHGRVTIEGKSQTPGAGVIHPISGISLNGLDHDLGIWNLETTPTYTADAYSILEKITDYYSTGLYHYKLNFIPNYKVVKNPAITKYTYSMGPYISYYEYGGPECENYKFYDKYTPIYDKPTYKSEGIKTLYNDSITYIYDSKPSYSVYVENTLPNKKAGVQSLPAIDFSITDVNIRKNVVFQVRMDTYYSSRTTNSAYLISIKSFIPKHVFNPNQIARPYKWTYEELRKLGYKK